MMSKPRFFFINCSAAVSFGRNGSVLEWNGPNSRSLQRPSYKSRGWLTHPVRPTGFACNCSNRWMNQGIELVRPFLKRTSRKRAAIRSLGLLLLICLPGSLCLAEQVRPVEVSADFPYQFDHPPAFADSVPPEYPEMARLAKLEGTVVARATIGADGRLIDTEILSKLNPVVDRAVIKALEKSTFVPASLNGENTLGCLNVSYTFDLDLWNEEHVRKIRPPIDWESPSISDVGELVEERGNEDVKFSVYSYDNIRFVGDIPCGIYESVMEQVRPCLTSGEVVMSFHHNLAFEELGKIDSIVTYDLEIMTCTQRDSSGVCLSGHRFAFVNQDGVYTLTKRTF